jgi:hypothetical protein
MFVIELVGREWAWLQSESDRLEEERQQETEASRSVFDEDALIERYRIETMITHFNRTSLRKAAVLAEVTAELLHIKDTDYAAHAPLGARSWALRLTTRP